MPIDFRHRQLRKIVQRLKSLLLTDLDLATRASIKQQLLQLDENYTNSTINFDQYKISSIALLCQFRSATWVEQFLYRETGTFLTQAEKFTLIEK
jgi:hypothetical protein